MIFTREKKETWNVFNKISLRFLFIYFVLYVFSVFFGALWSPFVYWIGEHIFTIGYEYSSNGYGSGDTTYAYLQSFFFLCLSIIVTFFWSVFDRKRLSYNQLNYAFNLLLRGGLILAMLFYGIVKVLHLQMTPPTLSRLMQPLGEISPMGLAWTFMGFSKGYSIFAGLAEVIAGLLLVSRRTQTLGAILSIAVMGNVFMMNLCFDIPVKLFSFHLLLMAVLLFLSDSKRIFNFFIRNRLVEKAEFFPVHPKKSKNPIRIVKVVLLFFLFAIIGIIVVPSASKRKKAENPPLYGIWETKTFIKNNTTVLPLTTRGDRWRYLIIDFKEHASIKMMDDVLHPVFLTTDTIKKQISIASTKKDTPDTLSYHLQEHGLLSLKGLYKNDSINIILSRKDKKDFLLSSRGFHWINERPLNK